MIPRFVEAPCVAGHFGGDAVVPGHGRDAPARYYLSVRDRN